MNTNFPDQKQKAKHSSGQETTHICVFDDLRRRLAQESPSRELSDLVESVNAMQRARNTSDEFDLRFEEFVYRAENYTAAVRPFFPALVGFLSSREDGQPDRLDASKKHRTSARVA